MTDSPSAPPKRVQELWFPDGNIVLRAENSVYKVFQGILAARSPIFQDMLSVPQASSAGQAPEDEFDGCPLVFMAGDSAAEMTCFLKAIFDSEFFPAYPARTKFATIQGCLRLAHKYEVRYLRQRALIHLASAFPMTLKEVDERWYMAEDRLPSTSAPSWTAGPKDTLSMTRVVQVLALAQEVEAPWILPSAFFLLSGRLTKPEHFVKFFSHGADAGTSAQLPDVQRAGFLQGHAQHAQITLDLVRCVSQHESNDKSGCRHPAACKAARLKGTDKFMGLAASRAATPLHVFRIKDAGDGVMKKACGVCIQGMQKSLKAKREEIWQGLPARYGVLPWSELTTLRREALANVSEGEVRGGRR
ncbi:hypothetical protein HMN09_01135500 [Mycena chlorophos]|uniref:BTB domain-containing protein n=1 Tax=Mycena chlorophos TaxID=658473 RepID=A0A8H6SDL1_MYCCL|nr:hypothetical protein HMN09_01135500 [Mycena chlorophos]